MLSDMVGRAKIEAVMACSQVQSEFAKHGAYKSSRLPISMEHSAIPIQEALLTNAMRLLIEFSETSGIPVSDLIESCRPKLADFAGEIADHFAKAGSAMAPSLSFSKMRENFNQRAESALQDVEIGFIRGRNALVTENSINQSKAMRLLQAIYDATRSQAEPVFISMLNTGLVQADAEAAWRYLKDRALIDTFSIPYTAHINGRGVDAIEGAKRQPDQPSANFPSVSYNIVNNTVNVETMSHSPVQQGGGYSTQHQTVTYGQNDLADLNRLVSELTAHLGELPLQPAQQRKAGAQVATLKAQLTDEPDLIIIRQAGQTLRNITEGAIGSLAATAVTQPNVWTWIHEVMQRLFT
jgi:hypothetical protein